MVRDRRISYHARPRNISLVTNFRQFVSIKGMDLFILAFNNISEPNIKSSSWVFSVATELRTTVLIVRSA